MSGMDIYSSHQNVAYYLEEHLEDCLACLVYPDSHRRRTTNSPARFNQDLNLKPPSL
jgi:hypothetical protein